MAKSPTDAGPFPGGGKYGINFKQPRVMDFRTAPGLAAGIKRVGGRSGVSRLGKSPISTESKHGRLRISHKY
jgi:hypothetical protein